MEEKKSKSTSKQPKKGANLTELEELQKELSDIQTKRLQLMADFENYKKRVESEKATFGAIANMALIQDLLEISDDINLALSDEGSDMERLKEVLTIAKEKLIGAAAKSGVEKVEVSVGDDFDNQKMEAISAVPDEKNKGKVIAVISSAYKYSGSENILKPAKVIVGR